jgi:hypothetical protein
VTFWLPYIRASKFCEPFITASKFCDKSTIHVCHMRASDILAT